MLFRHHFLERIRTGTVTVAFRRWQPSVKSGEIADFKSTPHLVGYSNNHAPDLEGRATRGADPSQSCSRNCVNAAKVGLSNRTGAIAPIRGRVAPQARLTRDIHHELSKRLQRLDAHSVDGPWTAHGSHSSTPRGSGRGFGTIVGQAKDRFKPTFPEDLGLTEASNWVSSVASRNCVSEGGTMSVKGINCLSACHRPRTQQTFLRGSHRLGAHDRRARRGWRIR